MRRRRPATPSCGFWAASRAANTTISGRGGGWDSRNVFHRLFGLPDEQLRSLVGDRQRLGLRPVRLQRQVRGAAGGGSDGLVVVSARFALQRAWLQGSVGRAGADAVHFRSADFGFPLWPLGEVRVGPARYALGDRIVQPTDRWRLAARSASHRPSHHGLESGARRRVRRAWHGALVNPGDGAFGGELYDERIASRRPGAIRPLYPDGSRYRTGGLFGQANIELVPSRLRLGLAGRWTRVSYSAAAADKASRTLPSTPASRIRQPVGSE